ncbi:MAG: hypothetical protein JNJ59_14990 [Deltaproteobacteria bacterium]|nr:hypothetical protein [Deltaproteobacteria bacterium]
MQEHPEFLTVPALCERFPFVKVGGVKQWLWRDFHGFRSQCARLVGRKMLISVPAFLAWIDGQKTGKAEGPRAA